MRWDRIALLMVSAVYRGACLGVGSGCNDYLTAGLFFVVLWYVVMYWYDIWCSSSMFGH